MHSSPTQPSEVERTLRGLSEREIDAHSARADLAARVAQALWSPLAHLSASAGRLLDSQLDHEQRQEVELVAATAEMMHALLGRNLTLEPRPEESGLQRAVFDLQDALAPVLKAFAPRARRQGIEFACRIASDVPPVLIGEPATLRAIVRLLLDEALRASSGEPIVFELGVSSGPQSERELVLSLAGLADDPICAPGLAVCARLAHQLDGRLWLELAPGQIGRAVLHVRCERVPERRRQPRGATAADRVRLVLADGVARAALLEELTAQGIQAEASESLLPLQPPADGESAFTALVSETLWAACLVELDESALRASCAGIYLLSSVPGRVASDRERALGVRGVLREPVLARELREALGRVVSGPHRLGEHPRAPAAVESLSVLLAEDDVGQRAVARGALDRLGHEVTCVEDGLGLIGALEERTYDVVLVDLDLPVLDGISAARLVRAREARHGGRTPIVALATNADRTRDQDLTQAGIDACLTIPLDADTLSWTLARLCGARDYESGAA
jgi:CheY-like chemotaxis protein